MGAAVRPAVSFEPVSSICRYINQSNTVHILRLQGYHLSGYVERAVFPGQQVFFTAMPDDWVEVHCSQMIGSIFSDRIPCSRLTVEAA